MLETALKLLRDPRIAALAICAAVLGTGFLYTALLFEWGPEVIRPASAQTVHQQVTDVKQQLSKSVNDVQEKLSKISDTQDDFRKQQREDRLERVEQQLQWWRGQNCKSKGQAKNYAWQKMGDLKEKYRLLTGGEWQMPSCSDIGAIP